MSDRGDLRKQARDQARHMTDLLAELVACESPSGNVPALNRCADLVAEAGRAVLGYLPQRIATEDGPHLLWAGDSPDPVMLLGHFDTVWPVGTLNDIPFTIQDGVARGPGVFDMKAGIVQMLTAASLVEDPFRIRLLLTCDEETGSLTSRELVESQAHSARAVLVGEPSADGGAVKIARKGISGYQVTAQGRAAHAGLEPELGINAGLEIAAQALAIAELTRQAVGTTVTPTVITAGTTANTVPERATVHVDARAWTRDELDLVDAGIRQLTPHLPGAALTITGGINRYPFELETALPLLAELQIAAKTLGLPEPDGVRSGGGSDGNYTAALGTPTLDGLGAIGAHPHGRNEHVLVNTMPDRTALTAAFIDRLSGR
ncbi:M20 family metallopeptidase [Yinghuangia sp. ASG 101]|uniref:M20 family metallopeptidase n=1 Tax=Yinghuangia sp. ASG 101 TaxID=2896848 RepID=UPI001E438542|nr:M20 family metallopeptidase [Yinghuangia sp. ASG 101]UGQ14864.1 M20 family metallopeptidase [Yinghuangia sp. ASG 101]